MLKLLDAALSNPDLTYFDINRNRTFSIHNILIKKPLENNLQGKLLSFLYVDNSITSISAFWNFYSSSSVLVLLSNQLNNSFKEQLEKIYLPDYIFDTSRTVIENYSAIQWEDLVVYRSNQNHPPKNIHPDIKILLSTSGTTGSPKFVKLSDNNVYQNALSILDYLPITNKDVTPLNLPINYSYGLSVLTTNSIAGGQIVCSLEDILSKTFWINFETHGFTSIAGVPYTYEVLNRIGFTKKNYPSLKYLTQAGGKLSDKLIELFAEYAANNNVPFYIMYGQTEATARMAYLDHTMINTKIGSIGKPIKNGNFHIAQNTEELIYSGPNIYGGYAQNLDDLGTFELITELKTGDIAKVDNEGYYYIVGRIKRFTKIFGLRINLDELEAMLKNNFDNSTFVCLGQNDKNIFIGFNNSSIQEAKIKEFIQEAMKINQGFIKVKYIEEMPFTANGKINYSQLSELYGHI
jgi:acyl-CoA synthetase (AMP-forming)/AMP-acid ligase II